MNQYNGRQADKQPGTEARGQLENNKWTKVDRLTGALSLKGRWLDRAGRCTGTGRDIRYGLRSLAPQDLRPMGHSSEQRHSIRGAIS